MRFIRFRIKEVKQYMSFWGSLMIIMSIILGVIGFLNYNNQEAYINSKYNSLLNINGLVILNEKSAIVLDRAQMDLEKDDKKKSVIAKKTTLEMADLSRKFQAQKRTLEQQKKDEMGNRIFDLITYISLAISIFTFGISLFWRKRDTIDSKVFQQVVINTLNAHTNNINQIINTPNRNHVIPRKKKKKKKRH